MPILDHILISGRHRSVSHIVEIQTEVRDPAGAQAACTRLGLDPPTRGTVRLYSEEATGLIVQFPNWSYPVVFNTDSGEARYDNYNGRWGDQSQLDSFLQAYAVEKAKIDARRKGPSVTEQRLDNGAVKLTVLIGGAA